MTNKVKYSIVFLMAVFLNAFSGHAQQYCTQVKLEFTDSTATQAQKLTTADLMGKHLKMKKVQADIRLEGDVVIVKMPCGGDADAQRNFNHGIFGIYETYNAEELNVAIDGIERISESLRPGAFGRMLDRNFAGGACIGSCTITRMEQFKALINLPESKKLLPGDVTFYFGVPEKGGSAVHVYAVKRTGKAPITIDMMKDAGTTRSYNGVKYDVQLEFKKEYKAVWAALTKKNTNRCLAIMLGDSVLSCPLVMAPIENGKAAISGNMDKKEAEEMAQRINFSLPLEVLITEVKLL